MTDEPTKGMESLFDALRFALEEERGKLIVALYELPQADLEKLVEAVQLIDAEGVDILDGYANSTPPRGRDEIGL